MPTRPFQAPPTVIDCTPDVLFDNKKWMPILPAVRKDRWPGPEEKYNYQFDREHIDKQVFDPFQDAGDLLREFQTPQACSEAVSFWKNESQLEEKGRDAIKRFQEVKPHDFFKIEP